MSQRERQDFAGQINRLMYSRNVLVLLAVFGILITTLVAGWLYRLESRSLDQRFYENVEERARFLGRELDAGVEAVYTLGEVIRFIDSLPAVVYEDVAGATLSRNPGLLALEWLPRVRGTERDSFEGSKQGYLKGYKILDLDAKGEKKPASARGVYFPVAYVAPYKNNTEVLGVDFYSNLERAPLLERAWNTGELTVSPPLRLIQMSEAQRGMLMVLPVYFGRPANIRERKLALNGFVIAAIDMSVLANTVIDPRADDTHYMHIEDITDAKSPVTLYEHGEAKDAFIQSVALADLGGRTLQITMAPNAQSRRLETIFLPIVVAVAGGLMVLLVCGYLYFLQRRGEVISEQVLERTQALREANFRLETLSVTDPLTGLSNRRAFDDYLEQEWQRGLREKTPISILLVDVDHFKKINDRYGHPAGDACLRELANRLRVHFKRPADRIVRFGGEEFAVVMPNTESNALAQAERFRIAMESEDIKVSSEEIIQVTVSAGLATVVPTAEMNPRDIVKLADEALYLAKRTGRNRIHHHPKAE